MAKVEHYYTQFEEGYFYHIYNCTIDKKLMFKNDGNYQFFLRKFTQYLNGVLEIYSYCLLPNHFHFLIRVVDNLSDYKSTNKILDTTPVHEIVSKQLRIFFQSYALAFNKQHERSGTLFQTPFKRALVHDNDYITQLIYYINSNPQKHKIVRDFREWKWSSYQSIILDEPNTLKKNEVIDWFGGINEYIDFHNNGKFLLNANFVIE